MNSRVNYIAFRFDYFCLPSQAERHTLYRNDVMFPHSSGANFEDP